MAVSSIASGDQTATIDTEHTLSTQTTAGVYVLVVDTTNMVLGDELTLRMKTKNQTGDSSVVAYIANFAQPQAEPQKYSPAVAVDTEMVVTLEQTAGTGRVFPWNLLTL